jgi:hypothetical protein
VGASSQELIISSSLSLLFSVLTRCGLAALVLFYQFTWQHTFVPVLPSCMLDISCSPTPFLMGVLAPCLPKLLELPIEEVSDKGHRLIPSG